MQTPTTDYVAKVMSDSRQFSARMYFTLNKDSERKLYENESIISVNILEEMSTTNETLPSNELKITMDNTNGDFSMLSLSNMQEIIGGKPKLEVELGLTTYENPDAQSLKQTFSRKVAGRTDINPHKGFIKWVTDPLTDDTPASFTAELSQANYDRLTEADWWEFQYTVLNNNVRAANMYRFDVIRALTDFYGNSIWQGKTAIADKVAIAESYITRLSCDFTGHGSNVLGNKVYFTYWNDNAKAWGSAKTHTSGSPTLLNYTFTDTASSLIDANGFVYYLMYADPGNGTVASNLFVDAIFLTIDVAPIKVIEWVQMGTFFLIEWKNETGAMAITLYARDNFEILSEITYKNTNVMTLYDMAVDILTNADITDFDIDDDLRNYSGKFWEPIDSRSAIQFIGLATTCAVFQNRQGVITFKRFETMDASNNYLRYSGQSGLYSGTYYAYPLVTTGAGMKYIDFDQMYDVPEISLEKSLYEIMIVAYVDPNDPEATSTYTLTNPSQKNGTTLSIDNPLITDDGMSLKVAEWLLEETKYNAIYKAKWRQNPILECGDMILMEDSFDAKRQTRIYKQEFNYEGYLEGNTESRGGI